MGKILSWLVLALLGYLAWRLVAVLQRKAEATRARQQGGAGEPAGAAGGRAGRGALRDERIVPCAHCGVHFPASEAVTDGELSFCCSAHRDAHQSA